MMASGSSHEGRPPSGLMVEIGQLSSCGSQPELTHSSGEEERRRKHVHDQLRDKYGRIEIMANKG